MLAQFVLLVFVLFATLSLVVDIGYARITQAEMQNAADTAALEGVRNGASAANALAQKVFDDDLDPTNGDLDQFGAGPVIDLTEGVTNLHALQTMSVPEPRVYKPDLQLNGQNLPEGDIVNGRVCYNSDPRPSEGVAYSDPSMLVCGAAQNGTGAYSRNDFNPGVDNSALLVRLRRSNEFQDFSGQEPGVASSGPSLPLLFGRATTIFGDDPDGGYSARRDGLTVRAAAIAATRPAMHVGLPQTTPATPGMSPFVLADTCVQSPTGTAATVAVTINPANGVITRAAGATAACPTGAVVGRFVANPTAIRTIGQITPTAAVATPCATAVSFAARYGAVDAQLATSGTNRIVAGFARINFTRVAACPAPVGAPFMATITRTASAVAVNTSATLTGALLQPLAGMAPAELAELICRNYPNNPDDPACAAGATYGPLLVPILAR